MSEENQFITSRDGTKLQLHHWGVEAPKKVFCIIHGHGEHGERYAPIAQFLNTQQIAVLAIDLRGHGNSDGQRGHARNYDALLYDVEELLKTAREEYLDVPMVLMGHSMGGNVVANFVATKEVNELSGFILSSPWLRLAFDPPAWKAKLANMVGGLIPSLSQPSGLDPKNISRDQVEVDKYVNDPLIHNKISAGLYVNLVQRGESVLTSKKPKIPGYIFHGTADQLTDPKSSEALSQHWGTEWKSFEGAYHEVLNDLDRETAQNEILAFINKCA